MGKTRFLFCFLFFNILNGNQDCAFNYEADSKEEAMEMFEKEIQALSENGEGDYELNDVFMMDTMTNEFVTLE